MWKERKTLLSTYLLKINRFLCIRKLNIDYDIMQYEEKDKLQRIYREERTERNRVKFEQPEKKKKNTKSHYHKFIIKILVILFSTL